MKKFLSLRGNINYTHISYRQLYFVAACSLLDPEVDGEIALKFRPYGSFIGIDSSRLDPLLKRSKVLRLHAALHDAAGFLKDCRNKGPGYIYTFRYSPVKQLSFWTPDRNIIHSISENSSFTIISCIGMLENFGSKTTNIIVLDLKGFKSFKSLGFIIKELSLCSSYNDTIFFKPPLKFADLPEHDRQTVIWLTNNLHGLDWDVGDLPYCKLIKRLL